MEGMIVKIDEVPNGYMFYRVGDKNHHDLYVQKGNGIIKQYKEFGREWKLSDCGFTNESEVKILGRAY